MKAYLLFVFLNIFSLNSFGENTKFEGINYQFCNNSVCYKITSAKAQTSGLADNKIFFEKLLIESFKKNGNSFHKDKSYTSSEAVLNTNRQILVSEKKDKGQQSIYLNMITNKISILEK